MWRSFLKITFRNFLRHRSFTFVNILGLAFGLSIFICIALYLQGELSFDKFHTNAGNLYRIEQIMNEGGRIERMTGNPEPLWQTMKDEFPEVIASIRYVPSPTDVEIHDIDGQGFNMKLVYVEECFLEVFSFPMVQGNAADVLKEPLTVVLTRKMADRLFGQEDPMGKTCEILGSQYRITGIVENPPDNSHIQFDALVPIHTLVRLFGENTFAHWSNNWVKLYVLLKDGHNLEAFNAQLKGLLKKHFYEETLNELTSRNILKIHLYSTLADEYGVRGSINNIYILIAIAIFILGMAAVNFTNLSVAYSSLRIKEVGIRKIHGGSRRLLLTQYMGEYLVMTLFSILLGFVFFETFLPLFNHLVSRNLSFHYLHNLPLFTLILALGLIMGLLSGLYPATSLSGYQPVQIMRMRFTKQRKSAGLREILIGLQFLISSALIISTLGVMRQASYMKNKDLGYNPRQVIRIPFRDTTMVRINTFRDLLLEDPRVINATIHDYPVCQSDNWTRISWEGAQEDEWIRINVNYVDHHYLETYEMRLVDGTGFTKDRLGSREAGREVILNKAAAQRMGFDDPVGRNIRYGGDYRMNRLGLVKIVGVVDDFHFLSVHNTITPFMLRLYDENLVGQSISVRLNGIEVQKTLRFIQEKFTHLFPELAFDYTFISDFHKQMYGEEDKMAKVIMALALVAIIISCLGIFGLVAFTTSRRTREVGIRKAMGADVSRIIILFFKEFLPLILVANLTAWPLGFYFVKNWLESFPYKVNFSLLPYVAALLLTILFTLVSMFYHTYKSARLQPAVSLRYE